MQEVRHAPAEDGRIGKRLKTSVDFYAILGGTALIVFTLRALEAECDPVRLADDDWMDDPDDIPV